MNTQKNQVKERPIILNADEVNAILAGEKTQHRTLVNGLIKVELLDMYEDKINNGYTGIVDGVFNIEHVYYSYMSGECIKEPSHSELIPINCHLGRIGDRLWVRETHRPVAWWQDSIAAKIEYKNSDTRIKDIYPPYLYPIDYESLTDNWLEAIDTELTARNTPMQDEENFDLSNPDNLPHWRSPVLMPRWASRLLLEIIDVRVERLQDISEQDAIAMGFNADCDAITARFKFGCYWDGKYMGKNSKFKRKNNPWVWVIEFEVIEGV